MNRYFSLGCVLAGVAAGAPSIANATVEPLVVVVETRPGAAVDPVEVRRAIAAELRTAVRGPRDVVTDQASDLLIVAVDRAEIRMSLRARAASVVSRAVPAPADTKARLQSISWLAGNLARDQVTAIVAPVPALVSVSSTPSEVEPASRAEVPPSVTTEPPPTPPSVTTEPPPLPVHTAPDLPSAPAGVVTARPVPDVTTVLPTWSLTIGGGPSALWSGTGDRPQPIWPGPGIWYLEVQRQDPTSSLIAGAALEVGPDMAMGIHSSSLDYIGGAAMVGAGHSFGRTFVEATAGLGVEVYQSAAPVQTTSTVTSTGVQSEAETVPMVVAGLYLRGQATAGLTLSRLFDLLVCAGGHLGTVGRMDRFLTGSLGLRFRFH